jgi:hypothetical protein
MLRPTPARRRAAALAAPMLVTLLLLAGCGGGSSDDGAKDDGKATTTTEAKAGGKTTTTEAKPDDPNAATIEQFATVLEGSGFDADQQECILTVAEKGMTDGLDAAKLDAAYADECGLSGPQVIAGAYYSAMVERGIDEKAAACARDLYGNLTVEQAAVFQDDAKARDSLLEGCGIDPADLAAE